ncbi:MAG: hypothetical protein AAGA48_05265 [Myxococcota bacterium]
MTPTSEHALTLLTAMLRDPSAVVQRMDAEGRFAVDGPRLLAFTVVGAALFGAVVGSYRGGLQVAFAALKMPVLLLLPGLVLLPALRALWALGGGVEVSYRRLAAAALVGSARSAVLAAAMGPILWLLWPMLGYHTAILWFCGVLAVAGAAGLTVVSRLVDGGLHAPVRLAGLALVGALSMQSGWMLRPFVARPNTDVALVRPIEDDVFSSLGTTMESALREDGYRRRRVDR